MTDLELGIKGEKQAEEFLKKQGYKIITKNFRTPFGQIDIIASEKNTLCFVEVKTRRNFSFGLPQEAVSSIKQKKILKVALAYLKENGLLNRRVRFDVVSILCDKNSYKINLIRGAFECNE